MLAGDEWFFAHFECGHHRVTMIATFSSSRPATTFLLAAMEQRSDNFAMGNFQKAYAARAAEFVRHFTDIITVAQSLSTGIFRR